MDLFFSDPNEIRLPPEEVRLREVRITTQPDSGRVKIHIELTPFLKRPDISIAITEADGKEVAHATILEAMLAKLELTMHLRQPQQGSEYSLKTVVYYQKMPPPDAEQVEIKLSDPMIVDQHVATFILS
jgi:hypothetical protein